VSAAAAEPPKANSNRSHAVQEILEAIIPHMQPWTWMSTELLQHLEGAFEATRSHHLMHQVRNGQITPEEAQELGGLTKVDMSMLASVFDLGIQAGLKLASDNEFRRMMGEEEV